MARATTWEPLDPSLKKEIEATGADVLDHASGVHAQFTEPGRVDFARLDALFRRHPWLKLRNYWTGGRPDLRFLPKVPNARHVRLDLYKADWAPLADLPRDLETLEIREEGGLVPLGPIAARPTLRVLGFHARAPRKDYPLLAKLVRLESLDLMGATLPRDVASGIFASLGRLRHLELRKCAIDLGALLPLKRLRSLELLGGLGVLDLAPLADLPGLRELRVYRSAKLAGLANAVQLERLGLGGLDAKDLRPVGRLVGLRSLSLGPLKDLRTIPSLARLARLEELTLSDLPALASLAGAARAPALAKLSVTSCPLDERHFRPFVKTGLRKLNLRLGARYREERVRALLGVP